MKCPHCGSADQLWRDEVDVGVGTIYGPWRCDYCGWDEAAGRGFEAFDNG